MPELAFWATSALVTLCVREECTPVVLGLSERYDAVVWWATPVEIASALALLLTTRIIGLEEFAAASVLADGLATRWGVVNPSDSLRFRAQQLVRRFELRSADALQLSAALEWCREAPRGRVFLASDKKLRRAALLSGFDAPEIG